ncbi:beta-sesquiphellandrene synthase-like [Panicum miliaceum]|uniref:Beta-sesquiphellandrene synthase-like n=1 Tax=Panicum miliaceum TaxID=4540 RepID=A0A3L6PQZ7_PANMI|nr:beta-sesquiphellandrene synthase-like [Panicum miliaceum]
MQEKARAMKEEVRRTLLAAADASGDDGLVRKLELVDALQRLGVDYHYKEEIDALLRAVCGDEYGGSEDLYATSLRFYLLRKHGYAVSSDVFVKFRDEQGNISSDDVNTLITLYDAAHMRVHGEDILDSIITFNKSRLQSLIMETDLEPALREEVRVTLETTRFRRVERVEARRFISAYEKKAARDDTLLEFAKLDYNIVQVVYCNELKELTIWWKDLRSRVDLTFSRDRLVEMHFWMMGIVYEPYYSYARIMLTKQVLFVALLDDIYDNYSSTEESNIFTTALERWDEKAAEQIPEYLRPFYRNALHVAKSYHAEVTWRDEHYIPADVDEHLQISLGSIAAMQTVVLTFVSLGDVTTREAIDWALTYPKIVRGVTVIARIMNDIMSHEREQASDHMASTVQTCMKQYGVTVEEAIEKLKVILEKAWMDMVQECLDQKYPMALLEKVVSFAQSIDFFYKSEDLYTLPCNLKDTLTSMYAKFVA